MTTWDILHVKSLDVEHSVPEPEVRRALAERRLSRDDCLRQAGGDRWWRIYELTEFRDAIGQAEVSEEPSGVEEPPQLEEGSLRNLLAEAEPPQEVAPARRPAARPAPLARSAPARPQARPAAARAAEPVATAPEPPLPPEEQPLLLPHRPRREEEDIDMAPAATISFLLILFFVIVSGVALQKAIQFPTPAPDDSTAAKPPANYDDLQRDNIMVKIKADNSIYVDDEPAKEAELVNRIATIRRDKAITDLVISAEDAAYHQTVVMVWDAANTAGIQNIKMAAVTKNVKKAPTRKRAIQN
jgi:biopolymer transport protein ExbD